jgi:hypothetical protein
MNAVFILWHSHEVDVLSDPKLIGVYQSREEAERTQARLGGKPGFRDHPEGFEIHEYELGRDGWTEGFISEDEAMETKDEAE